MATTHGLIIVDKRLRVLCVHPTNSPDNVWSIPKGGAEEGETSIQAALRETFEETNLDLYSNNFVNEYYEYIGCFPYGVRDKQLKAHVMYFNKSLSKMELDLKCNVKVDGSNELECDRVEWKDLSTALRYLHHTQVKALEKVLKTLIRKTQR